MHKIIITVNATDILGLKEALAMDMERYADVLSVDVQEVRTQMELQGARR